jgi:hypothetical protein
MRDKYDDAIEWLRKKDGGRGSYLDEVATLIEELLGRLYELVVESVSATESRWRTSPPRGKPRLKLVSPTNALHVATEPRK